MIWENKVFYIIKSPEIQLLYSGTDISFHIKIRGTTRIELAFELISYT